MLHLKNLFNAFWHCPCNSFFLKECFFFFSLDHLTVTEPVAVLKAPEVWGALRGKLMFFTLSCLFRVYTNFMADQEPADH